MTARTGLSAHAIRAWELRYRAVSPRRSAGGHRLYSDEDIERLRLLYALTRGGRRIGQIASLGSEELAALLREDRLEESPAPHGRAAPANQTRARELAAAAYEAVLRFDDETLETTFRRAALDLSAPALIDHVVVPLLERVGIGWTRGELRPAQEHLATVVVERTLAWVLGNFSAGDEAPLLLVTTPPAHRHALGAQLAAASAAIAGWRVIYLGPDLPAKEVGLAASATSPRAVALSLVFPSTDEAIAAYLRELRRQLPAPVAVLVGGPAAASYASVLGEIGAIRLESLAELRGALVDLARRAA